MGEDLSLQGNRDLINKKLDKDGGSVKSSIGLEGVVRNVFTLLESPSNDIGENGDMCIVYGDMKLLLLKIADKWEILFISSSIDIENGHAVLEMSSKHQRGLDVYVPSYYTNLMENVASKLKIISVQDFRITRDNETWESIYTLIGDNTSFEYDIDYKDNWMPMPANGIIITPAIDIAFRIKTYNEMDTRTLIKYSTGSNEQEWYVETHGKGQSPYDN